MKGTINTSVHELSILKVYLFIYPESISFPLEHNKCREAPWSSG